MNRLDMTYERACMATTKEKYYTKMLETLVDYNDRNNAPLSNEKLRHAVSKVMAETEEEERDAERNTNNATVDTLFHQSPVTNNTQGDISNVKNERRISLETLAETINGFNGLMIQSKINDSAYYDSEENDSEIDPNSNPKVATHTTNGYTPHTLFINRLNPEIIPATIMPIDQTIAEDYAVSGETLHARHTILPKETVTDAALSAARFSGLLRT